MLSVVIICKNEERFIEGCIKSVLAATSQIEDREIVVVDSLSTDRTVDLAREFPVAIYRLEENQRHTPAAGRYIGFLKTSGEYVLFVDGDSFLVRGFIEKALACFEESPEVAAVIGRRREVYYGYAGTEVLGEEEDINEIGDTPRDVSVALASALYRRDVLEHVGPFNPYLFSAEEAELSGRIRRHGYRIVGIPVEMVVHNTLPREKARTQFQRMKSNLHLGPGQVLRYRLQEGISTDVFREIGYGLDSLVWSALGFLSLLVSFAAGTGMVFLGWLAMSIVLFAFLVIKRRSFSSPSHYLLISATQAYALVRGFLLKPMRPETYPTQVTTVKEPKRARPNADHGSRSIPHAL